jgi:hypothetical protein
MKPIQLAKDGLIWQTLYSVTDCPLLRPNGMVKATIPFLGRSLNMLQCDERVVLKGYKQIALTVTVDCNEGAKFTRPDLASNTGTTPESVRFCIIRSMSGPYNRWFPTSGIELKRGKHTLTIPLDPGDATSTNWCSVYGKSPTHDAQSLRGFNQCLANQSRLAVIFGGGNHYGHGVSMERPHEATITINSLSIR